MTKSLSISLLILVLLARAGLTQQTTASAAPRDESYKAAIVQDQSPAQQRIAAATQQLDADPQKAQAYNELASAFIRRARETADLNYLKKADAALTEGLKLDPGDFQLQKTKVALMLSRHQYAQARELAATLNRRTPDDVMTYGYLAEADMALGDYSEAETNAQWMMNLRPNNTPALITGAKLRTLFGDGRGAIDFLNQAYSQTSPIEVGDAAWIANQIASIQIECGQNDAAANTLERAEEIFPHYPYTAENMARVRMGQNRINDAIQLWIQAAQVDKDPHILYELARSQELAGQLTEARSTYERFRQLATDPATATDASRLDLILMYSASPETAQNALRLAQQAVAERQDVWTLDAYGWALFANSNFADADVALQKAMSVGIRSAQLFDHAGHLASRLNHAADAAKFYILSLEANPSSEFALDARKSLGTSNGSFAREELAAIPITVPAPAAEAGRRDPSLSVDEAANLSAAGSAATINVAPVFAAVPESLLTPRPTGTEQLIRSAQAGVTRAPHEAKAYAALGAAYFQRARETGDVSDYQLAEQSLTKSLDLDTGDFSSEAAFETMAEVCMGEHRFADALKYAHKALSLGSGELAPFATIGDAYADMGEYDKAADAYSRLTPRDMTLSPRAAYARDSRVSYLKFISGNTAGAIELMKIAVAEGVQAQLPSENLAWLYYELGEYETQAGALAPADAAYLAAINTHPGDYRALAALARLRANAGRVTEAITLYQKAIAIVPMPTFISELGDLYAKSGNQAEAKKQYALVEYIGLLGHINQVLHNRDLAIFYADHDLKLSEALNLAEKELEVRHDVYTWDALGWSLYKNGKLKEAADASHKAMQFGTQDALLLFHAGMISEGLGQLEQARSELKEALRINPRFHPVYAPQARQRLESLEAQFKAKGGPDSHAR